MNFHQINIFIDSMYKDEIFTHNGIPAHHEAYLTVMDFGLMDYFLEKNKRKYTIKEWKELEKYFFERGYLSPINFLISNKIKEL